MEKQEILDAYMQEKNFRFEGEIGVKNLNKIAHALGYKEDGLLYGSSFESFLQDNPGCVELIFNWIREQARNLQWEN